MKLRCILLEKSLSDYYSPDALTQHQQRISNVMPPHKTKHSIRVAKHLAKAGAPKHVVDAGLFHDYPERGGNPADLHDIVHDQAHPLIQHMTNPNKATNDDPLEHLKQILPELDEETRNHLILVKCIDRIDNLRRRIRENRLAKSYIKSSRRLLRWLMNNFTGHIQYKSLILTNLSMLGISL